MGVVIFLVVLISIFLIAYLCARADEKDEEKHLEFLSEKIGYKVLTLEEWCEKNNINYSKYSNDKTVKGKYRSYILNIESKIEL